jgi:hypothetical protein
VTDTGIITPLDLTTRLSTHLNKPAVLRRGSEDALNDRLQEHADVLKTFQEPYPAVGMHVLTVQFVDPPDVTGSSRKPASCQRVLVARSKGAVEHWPAMVPDNRAVTFFRPGRRYMRASALNRRPEVANYATDPSGREFCRGQKPVEAVRFILRSYFPDLKHLKLVSIGEGTGTDAIAACEEGITDVTCCDWNADVVLGMRHRITQYLSGQRRRLKPYVEDMDALLATSIAGKAEAKVLEATYEARLASVHEEEPAAVPDQIPKERQDIIDEIVGIYSFITGDKKTQHDQDVHKTWIALCEMIWKYAPENTVTAARFFDRTQWTNWVNEAKSLEALLARYREYRRWNVQRHDWVWNLGYDEGWKTSALITQPELTSGVNK